MLNSNRKSSTIKQHSEIADCEHIFLISNETPQMADPKLVRTLISQSQKPLVFRGLVDTWPMFKFTQNDWAKFFENKQLECRVGTRSRGTEPQWETQSVSVQCTYCELLQWTENIAGGARDISTFDPKIHFLYFGYKHMKDVFDKEVLGTIDWGHLGYPERNGNVSTFWLGTPGAHTPCHYDTYGCNLIAQITGRKRWVLYPPEDIALLRPTRVPYEESSVYSSINFEQWPDSVPPIKGSHPHIVELVPGDVLFVPRHWWHHVRNQELSISINTWLEMPDLDAEARFHESLVKFLVAHTCRNVSPQELFDLLNPNEVSSLLQFAMSEWQALFFNRTRWPTLTWRKFKAT